jgi:hypothetical protein
MGLSKMISDLIQRLQDILKPYTLDQFIADGNPQDYADVQRLERIWQDYQTKKLFNTCY